MPAPQPRVATGPLGPGELADWYAVPQGSTPRRWVRASFVTTLDGRVAGPDGRSASLNADSPGDHAVFGHLRSWAQAVVVGAGTARTEDYPPLPGAVLAVLTRDGHLPRRLTAPATTADPGRDAGRDGAGDVVVLGGRGRSLSPDEVLGVLAGRGLHRILLEGGPQVLGAWVAAGVVDELCVTVRPVLVGGAGPLLVPAEVSFDGLVGRATHLLTWGQDVLVRTRLG